MALKDIKDVADLFKKVPSGIKLIKGLKLGKFKYIVIQKVLNVSIPLFVVTIDSKCPNREISYSRLKCFVSTQFCKIKEYSDTLTPNEAKLSFPRNLIDLTDKIPTDAVVILRDIAGEYFMDKKLYENYYPSFENGDKINLFIEV